MSLVIPLKERRFGTPLKITIATGLALFAMFFGAGNIVFPLYLGANSGQHILESTIGFILAGVGVPFLGLLATSLYNGNYHEFFARLGKWPAFLLITFLMVIIGPLAAMPRTEATTFHAMLPYLPQFLQNQFIFSILYCLIVYLLAFRDNKVVKILGLFLSPVKIVSFSALILFGFLAAKAITPTVLTSKEVFQQAISHGYNTMDLLATFFYCSVAFKSIQLTTITNPKLNPTSLTLQACIIGAIITGMVYIGFMWVAYYHAEALQGLKEEQMISAISHEILGRFGGLFVSVSVSFACVATALALSDVSSSYLHNEIFKKKISKHHCLILVIAITYLVSNLGFQGIMYYTLPLLKVVYPALIVLCIMNILYKWKGIKSVKLPVAMTMALMTIATFWDALKF